MISVRICESASWTRSECIYHLAFYALAHAWLHTFEFNDIHGTTKQLADYFLCAHKVPNRTRDYGIKIQRDVDITIKALLAAGDGSEDRSVTNAVRSQRGLGSLQSCNDIRERHRRRIA